MFVAESCVIKNRISKIQTIQWPKERGQRDEQRSTKQAKTKDSATNMSPTEIRR
jgi:hypothetical protein